jgi:succinoglycan biosynthesis protein ExoO
MPSISVIIPAFNAETFVGNALHSVLMQTYRDIQVIVVDDCSQDGTCSVVAEWMRRSSRIELLRLPKNSGVSAARNAGLARCSGDWVAVLDADDRFEPTRLERLLAVALSANAVLVADNCQRIGLESGAFLGHLFNIPVDGGVHSMDLPTFIDDNVFGTGRDGLGKMKALMCRQFLQRHELYYREELRICEDYQLYYEVMKLGGKAVVLGESLYLYTVRQGSLSHGRFSRRDLETLLAFSAAELDGWMTAAHPSPEILAALRRRHASICSHLRHHEIVEAVKRGRIFAAAKLAGINTNVWRLILEYGCESVTKRAHRIVTAPAVRSDHRRADSGNLPGVTTR